MNECHCEEPPLWWHCIAHSQSTAEPRLRRRWRQRAQPAETGRATRRATGSTARARKHESGDWGSSNDGSDGEDGDDAPFVPRSGESANDAKTRKAKEARAKRMERKRKGTEPSDDKLTRLQKRKVKNRESAARSRNRKQQYTDDLEQVRVQWRLRDLFRVLHCKPYHTRLSSDVAAAAAARAGGSEAHAGERGAA